jgi:hypothetical protein
MAQNTILAAGQTAATSTDVVVAAGAFVSIGIFASGPIPANVQIAIRADTPGADNVVCKLSASCKTTAIAGPGTFRAHRTDISEHGVDVGVYTEDA